MCVCVCVCVWCVCVCVLCVCVCVRVWGGQRILTWFSLLPQAWAGSFRLIIKFL